MDDEIKHHLNVEAASAVGGIVAGVVSGLRNLDEPTHVVIGHAGHATSKFFHEVTRSLSKNHKGVASLASAAAAGTLAVAGPTAGGVIIAAAPVLATAAVIAGAGYGIFKLAKFVKDR
jgi:hypothetical protein